MKTSIILLLTLIGLHARADQYEDLLDKEEKVTIALDASCEDLDSEFRVNCHIRERIHLSELANARKKHDQEVVQENVQPKSWRDTILATKVQGSDEWLPGPGLNAYKESHK